MEIDHIGSSPAQRGRGTIERSEDGGGGSHGLRSRIVECARTWIGTPYVHQASMRGLGCDCLGLLRGVWRDVMGDEPESTPPYSPDWSESAGREEMRAAFARHFAEIEPARIAPGDIALFRMVPHGPAKHCGIIGDSTLPLREGRNFEMRSVEKFRGGESVSGLTLIHSRANTRVTEEPFTPIWRRRLAFVFRL